MTAYVNPPILGAYALGEPETAAAARVLATKQLFRFGAPPPSENEGLEHDLTAWSGGAGSVTVSSGTAGLRAALAGVGVTHGDSVLVSALTFVATASAVASLGALPVPLELGPRLDVDLDDLERKLARAKAVVLVYVSGHTSNTDEVVAQAETVGVAVVEDACQAMGVTVSGHRAGVLGNLGVYSFQQGKQITAGEGGAIVGRDRAAIETCRRIADHGAERRADGSPWWPDEPATFGENLRLGEVQAAILRAQLHRIDGLVTRQRELRALVDGIARGADVDVVDSRDGGSDSGSHLAFLVPTAEDALAVQRRAATYGLLIKPFWSRTFADYPAFRGLVSARDVTPRASAWATRLLAVPIPPLDALDAERLIDAVTAFFGEGAATWRSS